MLVGKLKYYLPNANTKTNKKINGFIFIVYLHTPCIVNLIIYVNILNVKININNLQFLQLKGNNKYMKRF